MKDVDSSIAFQMQLSRADPGLFELLFSHTIPRLTYIWTSKFGLPIINLYRDAKQLVGDDEKKVGQMCLKFKGEIRQGVMSSDVFILCVILKPLQREELSNE